MVYFRHGFIVQHYPTEVLLILYNKERMEDTRNYRDLESNKMPQCQYLTNKLQEISGGYTIRI